MKPFRVTTRCALCDYTMVTIREPTESEALDEDLSETLWR